MDWKSASCEAGTRHGWLEQGTPKALMREAKHAYVRELLQTPHRHAERLNELMKQERS